MKVGVKTCVAIALLVMCLLPVTSAFANDCVEPPAEMISWWPADGTAYDIQSLAGGNHGVLINNVLYGCAKYGQAKVNMGFILDGSSRVEAPDSESLAPTGPFTLNVWMAYQGFSGYGTNTPIAAKWGDTYFGTAGYGLFLYTDGRPAMLVSPNGYNILSVKSFIALTPGEFVLLTGVWDGTAMKLYVNGVEQGSRALTQAPFDNAVPFLMGGYNPSYTTGSSIHLIGSIDEVELVGRALDQSEIQALYEAAGHGRCKPISCDGCK